MTKRDPTFDILFEPVKIGPVIARNRFYQVPHCNGMGDHLPRGMAAMRGVKAEGGWAVVSTEEVEIDHTTDFSPSIEGRLWDLSDLPYHSRMVSAVHAHNSLAAIELCQQGIATANLTSRETPIGPSAQALTMPALTQAREMDLSDIRAVRKSHRESAILAKRAGYDIIYVYAGHNLSLAQHFLLSRYNQRTDEYGGSLENRTRLLRELIEDTKEAVGNTCAVAVRLSVDELLGSEGLEAKNEGAEIIRLLGELPDLWDLNISDWSNDSQTSRFAAEGYQEDSIRFMKQLTSKPVVGVGRYTSPDHMASLIRNNTLDLIGAARPSIADPFLPRKIEEGRIEDIRECIGCNICVSGDMTYTTIRCTQNPTMGEEWRRGWHPESIPPKSSEDSVLIVGGGPAGLECARALGQRGYSVTLAEKEKSLGGRVLLESKLPGMSSYMRVVEHRIAAFQNLPNVDIYMDSELKAVDIIEFGADHNLVAIGSKWKHDGTGRHHRKSIPITDPNINIYTPDDILAGQIPLSNSVLIYDEDSYIMGGLIAEKLVCEGLNTTLMTPDPIVSSWTTNTLEQHTIQRQLLNYGVKIITGRKLVAIEKTMARHACVYTASEEQITTESIVLVTSRSPNISLWQELQTTISSKPTQATNITRIGDCLAPSTIAQAIYSGHKFAREFGTNNNDPAPYKREQVMV